MAEGHRKIEVQEQDDLRYLIANVQRVAADKINSALPPLAGASTDPMRARVQELVSQYIAATYTAASPNISLHGHSPSPALLDALLSSAAPQPVQEFEPLDARAQERARRLAVEEADLVEEVARLRREAPRATAEAWRTRFDGEPLGGGVVVVKSEEQEGKRTERVDLRVEPLERQADVERSWGVAVSGLERLKGGLPGTRARMERARRAGEYALGEKA